MESRLDNVLVVGRALKGLLLANPKSCLLNGDLVSLEGERLKAEDVDIDDNDSKTGRESVAVSLSGIDIDSVSLPGQTGEIGSECATAGASVDMREDDLASEWTEVSVDDFSLRKESYTTLAGMNEERSTEAILTHLSGGYVVSSTMARVGSAFISDGLWRCPVAIIRKVSEGSEWLVTGFVVGTDSNGRRTTLWRGKRLSPTPSTGAPLTWFSLGSVDESISVCLKTPSSWSNQIFYGRFPDEEQKTFDEFSDAEEEEYDNSPQYVLTVPGAGTIKTIVTFELLDDINYIDGTGLEVYGVPGEDYESADDPRVFWSPEFLLASSTPVCCKSSMTGLELDLNSEFVYMLVPLCSQPLQYCVRVSSEYALEIADFAEDSEDSDDSEVGSLY